MNKKKLIKSNFKKPSPFVNKAIRAFFLLFLICGSFFAFTFTRIWQNYLKIQDPNRYHVIMGSALGHIDDGFNQESIRGVCKAKGFGETLEELAEKCNPSYEDFRSKISYAFPGSDTHTSLLYRHIMNRYKIQNVKNFILPGFNFKSFIEKHVEELSKKDINLISIDTSVNFAENNWPQNLWQFSFQHFFAGYHAALYSGAYALENSEQFKDGDLDTPQKEIYFGSLGGMPIPPIYNYAVGFKLGIQTINDHRRLFNPLEQPETSVEYVIHENIGGFSSKMDDIVKDKSNRFFKEERVSILFSIAATLTVQMQHAAKEENLENEKETHYVIGVDVDQGLKINNESENEVDPTSKVLISATIKIPNAIATTINKVTNFKNSNEDKSQWAPGNEYFSGHDYGTIPERFTKLPLWNKITNTLPDKFNDLDQLLNANDEKVADRIKLLIKMIFDENSAGTFLSRVDDLHNGIKSADNFTQTIEDLINKWDPTS